MQESSSSTMSSNFGRYWLLLCPRHPHISYLAVRSLGEKPCRSRFEGKKLVRSF